MEFSMDCEICLEPYDLSNRRPKVMPCGHSACVICLLRVEECCCPECRKDFGDAWNLPDNYTLMRLIPDTRATSQASVGLNMNAAQASASITVPVTPSAPPVEPIQTSRTIRDRVSENRIVRAPCHRRWH